MEKINIRDVMELPLEDPASVIGGAAHKNDHEIVFSHIGKKLGIPRSKLNPKGTLGDLGPDSLDVVDVISSIMNSFDSSI